MTDDRTSTGRPEGWDVLGESWRQLPEADPAFERVDVQELRAGAARFARRVRYRNARELAACVFLVFAGGWITWIAARTSRPLVVIGGVTMALGAIAVGTVLLLRGRNIRAPEPDAPTRVVLVYERAQLERQARLLERVWVWYLAPLLPSIVAIYADALLRAIEEGRSVLGALMHFAITIAFFFLVGWLNARAARRLRARLECVPANSEDEPLA